MNGLTNKYSYLEEQLKGAIPDNILKVLLDVVQTYSSRRCHAQYVMQTLKVLLSESRNNYVYLAPMDQEAYELIDWPKLTTLGFAGLAVADANIENENYAGFLEKKINCVSLERLLGDKDEKTVVVCWTGKNNTWFQPKEKGLISLYDTVAYQEQLCRPIIESLSRSSSRQKILYGCSVPMYNFARQVGALDTERYDCRLLTVHPSYEEYPVQGFTTKAHAFGSIADFFYIISQVEVDLIHVYCTMNLYYQAMVAKLLASCPVVFEFNDTSSFFYSQQMFEYLYGRKSYLLETFAENFICCKMDGVIFQTKRGMKYQEKARGKLSPHIIFPPLPLKRRYHRITKKTCGFPMKLVYAGVIAPSCVPYEIYGDIQLRPVIDMLLEQDFIVDVYANDLMQFEDHYDEYRYLSATCSRFGFYQRIHPDDVSSVLTDYHFGLMVYDFTRTKVGRKHFETILPTKMMTYIEAGIPIIISEELKAVADIVEKYSLGIVVTKGKNCEISSLVRQQPYERVVERFRKGRDRLDIGRSIHVLSGFYERVTKGQV